MGRLLLTSSQVGVVLSALIIFLFTFALFLAGYVVQQNTVAHLREAIKPRTLPIHTDLYVPSTSNSNAAPSPKEDKNDFPELLSIEYVNKLVADPGHIEEITKEEDENDDGLKKEFRYQDGQLGASDDQASFAERRKADKLAALKEEANLDSELPSSEDVDPSIDNTETLPPVSNQQAPLSLPNTKSGPANYLDTITAEVKQRLKAWTKTSEAEEDAETLLAGIDPKDLTTAQRRKLFLAQLAKGKSPEVIKNPFEYRRRSWLER